jgi:RND family efflux transporter MFP subunit
MRADDELKRMRLEPEEKRAAGSRRTALVALGALLAVAAVVAAVLLQRHRRPAAVDSGDSTATVAAALPAPGPDAAGGKVIAAGGYVEARRRASLYPGRDGVVAHVYARLGERVRAGTLLLELDTLIAAAEAQATRADVDEARANLADAQRALERLDVLSKSAAVTEDEVERGRFKVQSFAARVGSLQARQRLAEGQLALSFLRAPFDGMIVRVDLEPGEVVSLFGVQSGVGAIELADLSEIWVRIDVPEDRIGSVTLGAPAEVAVDALGPAPLAAAVVEIAPVADRQSNTVKVAVRVLDPPPLLRPDLSARVTIHPKGARE